MKALCTSGFSYCKTFLISVPILGEGGGGHYGQDDHEQPPCFRKVRATTTKINDSVVSVYV